MNNLELLEDQLSAVVRAGGYKSKDEAVSHALAVLLAANSELRINTAVELYRHSRVTLARAVEIAGLEWEEFKARLAEQGISLMVEGEASDVLAGADLIQRLRQSP
jgi:predicted HTH domain antitoxin